MHLVFRGLIVCAIVPCIAACGGSGYDTIPTGPTTPTASATIRATPAIQFTPNTVNLIVGGEVTFEFGTVDHDVFFDNAPPGAPANIATPTSNLSVTRTFATPGRFVYNCHVHPGMTGTIVVQ